MNTISQHTKTAKAPISLCGGVRCVGEFFVIQRPDYPDWFAGWNAWGPIWTSRFESAAEVRADLLVTYMLQLAAFNPCASLLIK